MKIVIAPQAFKGSIGALDAAKAAEQGALKAFPKAEVIICPVADGGDGTLETLVEGSLGQIKSITVTGPTGRQTEAEWGAMGDGRTAVIEMARSSGLALLKLEELDPLNATTYGLGEIISEALSQGFRKFIIGIGGSATNDAGAGMAQALGVSLLDKNGIELPAGGGSLKRLHAIDLSKMDPRVSESVFLVACDVNNPLTGPEGASAIYGPQKGATPELVDQLDDSLAVFAKIAEQTFGRDISNIPGAGAAGGVGAGMMAFLNGELRSGVDIILETVSLDSKLESADLVITGEGGMDYQTVYDKAPIGVARMAKKHGIPTIGISGMLGRDFHVVHDYGIDAALSIVNGPITLEAASANAANLISEAVEQSLRLISIGITMGK